MAEVEEIVDPIGVDANKAVGLIGVGIRMDTGVAGVTSIFGLNLCHSNPNKKLEFEFGLLPICHLHDYHHLCLALSLSLSAFILFSLSLFVIFVGVPW